MLTAVQLPEKNEKVIGEVFKTIGVPEEEGQGLHPAHENGQTSSSVSKPEPVDELPEADLSGVKKDFQSAFGELDCHEE